MWLPCYEAGLAPSDKHPKCREDGRGGRHVPDTGSIIIVVGTNIPLSADQLNRVARRAALGLGRLGSYSGSETGSLIISFSTRVSDKGADQQDNMGAIFEATVEATEEAIVNALVAARTMTGADGYRVYALPHDDLTTILKKYSGLDH